MFGKISLFGNILGEILKIYNCFPTKGDSATKEPRVASECDHRPY